MTRDEQNVFLSKEYAEAVRYMDNAKETLEKARKEDHGYYKDKKYTKSACGVAYLGVLHALDAWFVLKDVPMPKKNKHKSIEFYMSNLAMLDRKMVERMNTAYRILHLDGYYSGLTNAKAIQSGFDAAYEIIDRIKPETFVEVKESRASAAKRVFNKMLISLAVTFG